MASPDVEPVNLFAKDAGGTAPAGPTSLTPSMTAHNPRPSSGAAQARPQPLAFPRHLMARRAAAPPSVEQISAGMSSDVEAARLLHVDVRTKPSIVFKELSADTS